MEFKVRVLPEFGGVADDLGQFFIPDDSQPGEVLARRGHIQSESFGIVDCVFTYDRSAGLSGIRVVIKPDDQPWHVTMGSSKPSPLCLAAEAAILGFTVTKVG